MNSIKLLDDINKNDLTMVGGKALSLGRILQAGLPVPNGFVITTEVHRAYKHNQAMGEEIKSDLYSAFDTLGVDRVAVRSSAIFEDSPSASWAGQLESFMNVTKDKFLERVQDCWNSIKETGEYAKAQGLKEREMLMGVVVQTMIDSDVSGVAFSVNPLNHESNEVMVEATYGLGELLVQGVITPDNYVLSKPGRAIVSSQIATKTKMLVYQDGGTKEVPVDINRQTLQCLLDEQLQQLIDIVCRIENFYNSPQDIEWALRDGQFFILQSRPITTV